MVQSADMDKESELLKIQVHADYLHTRYNSSFSYVVSFYISVLVVITTVSFEHLITLETSIVLIILIGIIFISEIYDAGRRYKKKIEEICEDIDALGDLNNPSIGDDM